MVCTSELRSNNTMRSIYVHRKTLTKRTSSKSAVGCPCLINHFDVGCQPAISPYIQLLEHLVIVIIIGGLWYYDRPLFDNIRAETTKIYFGYFLPAHFNTRMREFYLPLTHSSVNGLINLIIICSINRLFEKDDNYLF